MSETVKPIKDLSKIDEMKKLLLLDGKYREFLLFTLGINTGLRISDLLLLKWKDIMGDEINLVEEKTGKKRSMRINKPVKKAIGLYLKYMKPTDMDSFVFESDRRTGRPFTRQYIWKVLSEYAQRVGIVSIGTHSMRKTFGYHAYQRGVELSLLCKVMNHSAPSLTLRYIGIEKENMDDVYDIVTL